MWLLYQNLPAGIQMLPWHWSCSTGLTRFSWCLSWVALSIFPRVPHKVLSTYTTVSSNNNHNKVWRLHCMLPFLWNSWQVGKLCSWHQTRHWCAARSFFCHGLSGYLHTASCLFQCYYCLRYRKYNLCLQDMLLCEAPAIPMKTVFQGSWLDL